MEKMMLPCTDQTILIPYFDGHDVAILQGDTVTVQYYGHVPSCVKEYKYLVTLAKPEVWFNCKYTIYSYPQEI